VPARNLPRGAFERVPVQGNGSCYFAAIDGSGSDGLATRKRHCDVLARRPPSL
jgi:hypothetical protein